jgi:hypothetical protein
VAINFKLRYRYPLELPDPTAEPMGRDWVGYQHELSDEEIFEQNRGIWYLGPRSYDQRYATFSYDNEVVVVAEISEIETIPYPNDPLRPGKQAVVGRVLKDGDPAYDYFIGQRVDQHRNPVTYIPDPDARDIQQRTCACGCGTMVTGRSQFASGHDQRAVHERIRRQWGDTLGFIRWFDATYPEADGQDATR